MRSRLTDTVLETLHFYRAGKSVGEISRIRGLKEGTIYTHLEEAMLAGEEVSIDKLIDSAAQREIASVFERVGSGGLSAAMEALGGRYSYGQLRICRAAARVGSSQAE